MTMKTTRLYTILSIVLLTILLQACAKDDSTTPDPGRSAFIGTWVVTPVKASYEVTISADPNSSDGVFISNFYLIGQQYAPASASIKGSTITLDPDQVIGSGLTVNGSGVLSGNRITWSYTVYDGADLLTISEIYSKK